jgi:histidinol phosphatase-like enzyme
MSPRNKALFLDRDGVINVDKGYVGRVEEFEFVPGILELCRRAQALKFLPFGVTIRRGLGEGSTRSRTFRR